MGQRYSAEEAMNPSTLRYKVEEILGVSHTDEPPTEEVAALVQLIESEKREAVNKERPIVVQEIIDALVRSKIKPTIAQPFIHDLTNFRDRLAALTQQEGDNQE